MSRVPFVNSLRVVTGLVVVAVAASVAVAVLAGAAAAPVVNPHAREPIGSVQQVYDGTLLPDIAVNTFRNIDRLFPVRAIRRGARVQPLPASERRLENVQFTSGGREYDLYDYMAVNRVTGLLVLKQGKIALERYQAGNTEKTRWMSMSMVKSITSTLIGAAIKDGHIQSLDDPLVKYLPDLAGSAYDGVSIRNLLQMASGVKWDETYTNPQSDRRRMLQVQQSQVPGGVLALMAKLPRAGAPGTRFTYSTGETHVAGALLRAAVKKPLADYLSERIWARYGMEADATWWLESPDGLEVGGSGLSATLRDYGRFGLFFSEGGLIAGEPLLPDHWREDAGSPKLVDGKAVDYGYMLWPTPNSKGTINEGTFEARGIFGQHVFMNPAEHVVIVVWSAQSKPTGRALLSDNEFFAAVTKALH